VDPQRIPASCGSTGRSPQLHTAACWVKRPVVRNLGRPKSLESVEPLRLGATQATRAHRSPRSGHLLLRHRKARVFTGYRPTPSSTEKLDVATRQRTRLHKEACTPAHHHKDGCDALASCDALPLSASASAAVRGKFLTRPSPVGARVSQHRALSVRSLHSRPMRTVSRNAEW
jgi:hypothetical protein